jgi:murein tripeptide amidase MpaA
MESELKISPKPKFNRIYSHQDISDFLIKQQSAAPSFVKISTLGKTPEGREILYAEITDKNTGLPDEKPAYYMQANLHANEMAGTNGVLQTIYALLNTKQGRHMLKDITFYMVPRTNPDGAEYTINTGSELRSSFRIKKRLNGVIPNDIDGDGKILNMRWEDPSGPFALDEEDTRVMVPRRPGDKGPFYQQHVEGIIHEHQPGAIGNSFVSYDFNRNFPIGWDSKIDRADYPLQHSETRAIADFLF